MQREWREATGHRWFTAADLTRSDPTDLSRRRHCVDFCGYGTKMLMTR